MELAIIRRESAGSGGSGSRYNESETVTKFEIMDGAPVKGECIPVRLYLSGFDLTPTYRKVNNKFSTRYYLNLVLVDEEDRRCVVSMTSDNALLIGYRYFKQQEITLYRNKIA